MRTASLLKYVYLSRFSQPPGERNLYRAIRRGRAKSIVELGVAMGRRSARLIEVARRYHPAAAICYAGIDLFEARDQKNPGMTLKRAHRLLSSSGVKVRLLPGDPFSALARAANQLTGVDLLLVAADQDRQSLERAWFYVPRMLHPGSQVFVEERTASDGRPAFRPVDIAQITRLGQPDANRRAA